MSPAIYTTEGSFDKSGKVFTEVMEGPDPKGKPMKMRLSTDKDHMNVQMYARDMEGNDMLMMEIAYTRKR